jgi:hypothetical protein
VTLVTALTTKRLYAAKIGHMEASMHRILTTAASLFMLVPAGAALAGPAKPYVPPATKPSGYGLACSIGTDQLAIIRNVGRYPIRHATIYVTFRFGKFEPATTKPRAISVGYALPVNGTMKVAQPKDATSCSAALGNRAFTVRAQ